MPGPEERNPAVVSAFLYGGVVAPAKRRVGFGDAGVREVPRKRILIVEDEPLIAMGLEDILFELGLDVVGPAFDLDTALALVEGEQIEAAILDLNIAGEPSYPVADVLRKRDVPYVFATGYGGEGVDPAHSRAAMLTKPYGSGEVRDALAELFEAAANS